jgi:hypothetical protein
MTQDEFLELLRHEAEGYNAIIATDDGERIVKGFIDIFKRIYTITIDTKVVSKVLEILLIPALEKFAQDHYFILELPAQQNFYPDLTFIHNPTGDRFAVDIKSTFKDKNNKIKSMTLGAFTGYFRNRTSTKNTSYPYGSYKGHFVLGVIYSQNETANEKTTYALEEIEQIESVIKDFKFFVQPKYKIASASPGSGNTKNIGSINNLKKLISGLGIFSELGEELYDDYWMYYLTVDMAKSLEIERPYKNLKTYLEYKQRGINVLEEHKEQIMQLSDEEQGTGEPVEDAENDE